MQTETTKAMCAGYELVHPQGAEIRLCRDCADSGLYAGRLIGVQAGARWGLCEGREHGRERAEVGP